MSFCEHGPISCFMSSRVALGQSERLSAQVLLSACSLITARGEIIFIGITVTIAICAEWERTKCRIPTECDQLHCKKVETEKGCERWKDKVKKKGKKKKRRFFIYISLPLSLSARMS